ncbi:MAG: alkaline phosphatase family protein [Vicinamibacterales bacterium]
MDRPPAEPVMRRTQHRSEDRTRAADRSARPTVLAIGIDAAEPVLVRRLIDRGELPALARLLRDGAWRAIEAPAAIGSGAVWPTFFTGSRPLDHGVHSYWTWNPATMRLADYDDRRLTPFWQQLAHAGVSVGVLDVPFAPFLGLTDGFEVSEWGSHDLVHGRTRVSPATLRDLVVTTVPPHPFMSGHEHVDSIADTRGRAALHDACIRGARARGTLAARLLDATKPTLALLVFGEAHRAGHHLWHTVEPHDGLYARAHFGEGADPDLAAVYREIDRQIGRLVEQAGPDATTIVFSLHGMRPARGVATLLEPFLRELGFAHLTGVEQRGWSRPHSFLAAARHGAPPGARRIYRRLFSHAARHRWRTPKTLPRYDWSRTRAFALPTDQHGWIRLNLRGREVAGIVPAGDYQRTCDTLEAALRGLRASDGRRTVRDILRPQPDAASASTSGLPDLVVHWDTAALEDGPQREADVRTTPPTATQLTGQHAFDGFCIVRSPSPIARTDAPIAAEDLHRLMIDVATPADDPRPPH